MEQIELLYDHYKESFSLSKATQKRRNKEFLVLCTLEALLFMILIRPEKAFEVMLVTISKKLDVDLLLGNTILQTLLWLLVVYVTIRYIQDMLYIERQYIFLGNLEKKIEELSSTNVFSREGDNYQKAYPIVLNLIDLFYKMFMPIFFCTINVVRIRQEWTMVKGNVFAIVCDTVLCGASIIITWFYFFEIHPQITNFCKKHIPLVDKVARILRKVLKEV